MKPVPIRYIRDVDAARAFYQALGLTHAYSQRPTRRGVVMWTELHGGDGGQFALHAIPDEPGEYPRVELSFESGEPLETVLQRIKAIGYQPETEITDETFGRSFTIRDPEGLLIQVNEHDRDDTI